MKIIKNFFTFFILAFLLATCSESTTSSPSVDPNIPALKALPTLKALIYTNAKGNLITSINSKPGVATKLYPKLLNLPEGVSATNYAFKDGYSLPPGLNISPTKGIISGTFANADEINNHKSTIIAVLDDSPATPLEYSIIFNLAAPTTPQLYYTNKKGNQIASITAIWGQSTNLSPSLINLPGEATATGYALKVGSLSLPTGLDLNSKKGVISGNLYHPTSLLNHEATIEVTLSEAPNKLDVALSFNVPLPALSYHDDANKPISTFNATVADTITLTPSLDNVFSSVSIASYKIKSGTLPSGLTINHTSGVISGTLDAGVNNAAVTIEATLNDDQNTTIEKVIIFNIKALTITFNINTLTLVYTNVKKNEISKVVAKAGVSTNLSPKDIPTGAGITYAFKGNTTASTNGLKINTRTGLISGMFDRSFTNNITVELTLTINRVNTVLENAITFEIEPAETPFSARFDHQVVAHKDEMYLIGGNGGDYENDVWKSSDGANWVEVTKDADFPARWGHQVVVFKNEMYLISGEVRSLGIKNDVWKSSDGVNWIEVTNDADFFARRYHQVVVLGDKMYLIGGFPSQARGDVWESSDGKNWTRLIEYGPFVQIESPLIYNHQVVVLNNTTMYLIAGLKGFSSPKVNDVYSSTDGVTWSKLTTTGDVFSARDNHQVVVLDNKMYLTGGDDGTNTVINTKNDVWKSSDGAAWEELISDGNAPFSKRYLHKVVVLGGEMYLIGGTDGTDELKDVWKSSNGKDWFLISK